MRDLIGLPKAHLHLHFTGSMRPTTVVDLAAERGVRLPQAFLDQDPLRVAGDTRGWFRFQRLYDAARAVVRDEPAMRRVVREAIADDAAEGSVRLEIQVDPTSYAPYVGGITPAVEIILDEVGRAAQEHQIEVGVIIAASRLRHPLDARTLARLAVRYPGKVVGFGLSNDERRGETSSFGPAFDIARRAGLAIVPHGGELLGPDHITQVLDHARPDRLGHGVRSWESPEVLGRVVDSGVALEVCPASNVALGVFPTMQAVPLRRLVAAGATVALGADDPLLFRARLVDQYRYARDLLGFSDPELADLARSSIKASRAETSAKQTMLAAVDAWISNPG